MYTMSDEAIRPIALPPAIHGPAPRLDTVNEVETILRKAAATGQPPLSLAEIGRRMQAKAVRHHTVRTAVDALKRFNLVAEGSKGVLWVVNDDPAFWTRPTVRLR
jgi:hypothetical protein